MYLHGTLQILVDLRGVGSCVRMNLLFLLYSLLLWVVLTEYILLLSDAVMIASTQSWESGLSCTYTVVPMLMGGRSFAFLS